MPVEPRRVGGGSTGVQVVFGDGGCGRSKHQVNSPAAVAAADCTGKIGDGKVCV